MKTAIIGLAFLATSAVIYGATLIAASIYTHVLLEGSQGWDTRYGVYGTALREVGTLPTTLSVLSGIIGLFFIILSIRKK